ncbi:MAG: glycosyltransferase family 2 protein [Blastocatellia bacterium]
MDGVSQSVKGHHYEVAADDKRIESSVIIVNYNAGDKLLRCLSGVVRSAGTNCEVFVVDNASADGAADIVESDFPEVIVIRSETNLGFGAGCNLGARRARGQYLVFLNPDTIVEAGWLEALIRPIRTEVSAGLVTAKILLAGNSNLINTCGNTVHITGIALCRGLGCSRDALNEPGEVAAVSGAAFSIRRSLFELLGGFDEDMFLYMEDTDLSLRARLAGWRCLYAPDSIVLHDYALKMTSLKVFYQERNRYLMLLKNLRWGTLVVSLPIYLLAELITWSFVLFKDRHNIGNKVLAFRWIAANWRAVMRKRNATQSLRNSRDRDILRTTDFRLDFKQVSPGLMGSLAGLVFNPLFLVLRLVTMSLVWW